MLKSIVLGLNTDGDVLVAQRSRRGCSNPASPAAGSLYVLYCTYMCNNVKKTQGKEKKNECTVQTRRVLLVPLKAVRSRQNLVPFPPSHPCFPAHVSTCQQGINYANTVSTVNQYADTRSG